MQADELAAFPIKIKNLSIKNKNKYLPKHLTPILIRVAALWLAYIV